jgi:hypothetical protein
MFITEWFPTFIGWGRQLRDWWRGFWFNEACAGVDRYQCVKAKGHLGKCCDYRGRQFVKYVDKRHRSM